MIQKNLQYYKFCAYGFLKNLRLFDPFILVYLRSVEISFFEIGILYSIREISTVLLEVPTGIVADILGRKKSLLFSFTGYIISFLIFYYYSFFTPLIFAMFFFAVGDAFRTGTHKAMIFDYLKTNNLSHLKTNYYGHTRSWSQKGSALSSIIGGLLILIDNDYSIIFIVSVIPYLANFLNISTYPKELDGPVNKSTLSKSSLKEFSSIFRNPEYRIRVINSASFDGLFKTIKDYLQPIISYFALLIPMGFAVSETQKSTIFISLIYSLIYILNSIASKNSAPITKKFKNISSAINYSFLIGVVFALACGISFELNIPAVTLILFIVLYSVQNIRRPMNISYISETIPDKFLSSGLSVESQTRTLIIAILSPILGFFADYFGIGWAIASTAVIILLFYPIVRVKNKD